MSKSAPVSDFQFRLAPAMTQRARILRKAFLLAKRGPWGRFQARRLYRLALEAHAIADL